MSGIEILQIWIIAFFTLALFSFLYKDNPFYRLAENIFAGLTTGYQVSLIWDTVIIQKVWDPMMGGQWWLFLPGLLGLMMFTRFSPKISWMSRVPLAVVMGITAGIFLTSQLHGFVLPQLQATMNTFVNADGFAEMFLASLIAVGVISTMIYFYFSHEHVGVLGVTAKLGIWFIMISFGAHFGYTVMGRFSLLIGRTQFLIEDWIGTFSYIF